VNEKQKRCGLCGKEILLRNTHITAQPNIDVDLHVACLYAASPIEILKMLELAHLFKFMENGLFVMALDRMMRGVPDRHGKIHRSE